MLSFVHVEQQSHVGVALYYVVALWNAHTNTLQFNSPLALCKSPTFQSHQLWHPARWYWWMNIPACISQSTFQWRTNFQWKFSRNWAFIDFWPPSINFPGSLPPSPDLCCTPIDLSTARAKPGSVLQSNYLIGWPIYRFSPEPQLRYVNQAYPFNRFFIRPFSAVPLAPSHYFSVFLTWNAVSMHQYHSYLNRITLKNWAFHVPRPVLVWWVALVRLRQYANRILCTNGMSFQFPRRSLWVDSNISKQVHAVFSFSYWIMILKDPSQLESINSIRKGHSNHDRLTGN